LLIRRNTLLVLDLSLHVIDSIARLDLERDGLASESLGVAMAMAPWSAIKSLKGYNPSKHTFTKICMVVGKDSECERSDGGGSRSKRTKETRRSEGGLL
jgi:hypothetical protein